MKIANFTNETEHVEMSFTLLIPKTNSINLDKATRRSVGFITDIIGAFSPRIIASLERRMQACQRSLVSHLEDIEYNDGMQICWNRKNGTIGSFNIPSFKAMQNCIKALEKSDFTIFCTRRSWIDQTLKALLNDTEQDHSDMGGFCYSQLVSILCDLQSSPYSEHNV